MIPYGHQDIIDEDILSVTNILQSEWLTQGPTVDKFESCLAQRFNAKGAVAVSSGTAALHVTCLGFGLTKGDIVWTSPNSFVASANCALYCQATVDFVDIDPITYNLCPIKLEQKLKHAKRFNRLPKMLIVVHFGGQSCDMQAISKLAKAYNFIVIEDASHAIGTVYQGKPVGGCYFSDATIFSFHPVKTITTGEGGAILSNHSAILKKIKQFASHGITREIHEETSNTKLPWEYFQFDLGYNYRMTDIQAALGISQLKRLERFKALRAEKFDKYNEKLSNLDIQLPYSKGDSDTCWHLYVINLLDPSVSRLNLFNFLRMKGIGVNVHYIPIHTQPFYQNLGFKWGDFPECEKYYSHALTLPLYPNLSYEDQNFIIRCVKEGMKCSLA